MLIHIGEEVTYPAEWIVAVFDMDRCTRGSLLCQKYLTEQEKQGRVQWLGPEIPRSVVITLNQIYLSPVRAETIASRMNQTELNWLSSMGARRPKVTGNQDG